MSLIKIFKSNFDITLLLSFFIPICFIIGNAAINILSFFYFLFFALKILKKKNFGFLNQKYIYLLSICYIFIIISLIFSDFSSTVFFKSLILIKIVILPICFHYFFLNFSRKIILFYISFLVVLFICFDAWIQYFFGINFFGSPITGIYDNSRRISGIFFDEKILGSFLKTFTIFSLCYILMLLKDKKINIIFTYLFFLFCFFTIFITQERSSFLVFTITSIFIFFYIVYKNKKNIVLLLLPILITLYLFTSDSFLKNRYISVFSAGAGFGEINYLKPRAVENNNFIDPPNFNFENIIQNFTIKNSLWGAHFVTAAQIFKNNPFFGSGPRTFRYECSNQDYDKLDIKYLDKRCSTHPHNFVFEILSELGLFGFFSFFFTFIYIIYSRVKVFFKTNNISYKLIFLTFFMNNWPLATTGSFFASQNIFINSLLLGLLFSYNSKTLFYRS